MYSAAQTTTLLGGWGKRGEIKADHVKRPKSFVPHCSSACYIVRISMTSPININVPTGALLDAETKGSFVRW